MAKTVMLEALQFVATLSAALFAGAAIYINVAEHPARMSLDTRSAASQWAPSYKRATWMQAPLAVISFLAGVGVWLLGGGLMWLVAALFIGAVVPVTFMVIMPTNHRLLAVGRDLGSEETRQLLQRWGKLHGVRSIASGIATILMLWGLALCTAAYGQTFPEPRTLKINDRVFVLLGPIQHANRSNQGYMINSTVIVGDKGVILVDSGGSDEVGRHIASAVRRITQKPVTHVVNTHHHGDHHLGNVAFEGATFISSEMCRKTVLETGREWLAIMERDIGRRLPGTTPVAAQVTYPEGTRTQRFIHGVRVVFWVPRGSHTAGDLLVHLPDDDVLVAGDVLVSRVVPTLQDGFVKNWIQTLDEIRALGVAHFVPGHGDLMTRNDVDALREAMFRFHSGVKEGFRRGQNEAQIRRSLDLSAWNTLERSYVIGRNINQAYLEIEADSFDE